MIISFGHPDCVSDIRIKREGITHKQYKCVRNLIIDKSGKGGKFLPNKGIINEKSQEK